MATEVQPEQALRVEIIMGMSAPPIGKTINTPKSKDKKIMTEKYNGSLWQ